MNVSKTTTPDLVDAGGKLKADIATKQDELAVIDAELSKRVVAGEAAEAGLFRAAHVQQNCNTVAWKKIAESMNPSRQKISANTSPYTKDYIKYTARKTS